MPGDVIAGVLAHHRRVNPVAAESFDVAKTPAPTIGYRPESIETLFGRRP